MVLLVLFNTGLITLLHNVLFYFGLTHSMTFVKFYLFFNLHLCM